MWHLRGIFAAGTYLAIMCEVALVICCSLVCMVKFVGSIWPFSTMTLAHICSVAVIFVL